MSRGYGFDVLTSVPSVRGCIISLVGRLCSGMCLLTPMSAINWECHVKEPTV